MSEQTVALLIGAGIGVGSSLLTIVATGISQFIHEAISRKWRRTDELDQIERQLVSHRVDDLEAFATEIALAMSSVNDELPRRLHDEDKRALLAYCAKLHNELTFPMASRYEIYLARSLYFPNKDIFDSLRAMLHLVTELALLLNDIMLKLEAGTLDSKEVDARLANLSILVPYSRLLLILDWIRADPYRITRPTRTPLTLFFRNLFRKAQAKEQ